VSDPAISALLQVGAMQGLVNSSNRPSKAECMSDRRLTSRSTDKDHRIIQLKGQGKHAMGQALGLSSVKLNLLFLS